MKALKKQYESGQLPEGELTAPEQQLLKNHLDRERIRHWDTVIAREESARRTGVKKTTRKWIIGVAMALAATLAIVLYSVNVESGTTPQHQLALREVPEYPFSEQQVRGTQTGDASDDAWHQAVAFYRTGQYERALAVSRTLHEPFLAGMCLLYLERYEESLQQFDQAIALPATPVEIHYYKGIAHRQLGQAAAAESEFEQVLKSKEIRGLWKEAATKELDKIPASQH